MRESYSGGEDVAQALRLGLSFPRLMGSVSRSDESASECRFFDPRQRILVLVYVLDDAVGSGGHLAQVDDSGGAMVYFSWSPNAASLSLPESASSSHAF